MIWPLRTHESQCSGRVANSAGGYHLAVLNAMSIEFIFIRYWIGMVITIWLLWTLRMLNPWLVHVESEWHAYVTFSLDCYHLAVRNALNIESLWNPYWIWRLWICSRYPRWLSFCLSESFGCWIHSESFWTLNPFWMLLNTESIFNKCWIWTPWICSKKPMLLSFCCSEYC